MTAGEPAQRYRDPSPAEQLQDVSVADHLDSLCLYTALTRVDLPLGQA